MTTPPRPAVTDGLVVVDKAGGMTSHDVVSRFRRIAHTRRVGHAGTLDPMATGVLVLAIGNATRLLSHLDLDAKTYHGRVRLGLATTTDDAEGEPLSGSSAAALTADQVIAAIAPFVGDIQQVPSSVSAIKVNGERAYKLARAGEVVELAARPVTVRRFDATAFTRVDDYLDIDIEVDCTAGTYIRALARDLGIALGVGGHLTALRRLRVGPFTIDQALSLEQLAELADPVTLPLSDAVRAAMPVREVDAAELHELSFGRALTGLGTIGPHAAVGPDGAVVALLREEPSSSAAPFGAVGAARPIVVFAAR